MKTEMDLIKQSHGKSSISLSDFHIFHQKSGVYNTAEEFFKHQSGLSHEIQQTQTIPCSFSNIPDERLEQVSHSINSINEEVQSSIHKDLTMNKTSGELEKIEISTPQFENMKINNNISHQLHLKEVQQKNQAQKVGLFSKKKEFEEEVFEESTPKKDRLNDSDELETSLCRNTNEKEFCGKLKEMEKMDIICSIDQNQEQIRN